MGCKTAANLDGITPTSPEEATDFRANAFKEATETNAYEGKTKFMVRVLTTPVEFYAASPNGGGSEEEQDNRFGTGTSNESLNYAFKGRIIDEDILSPHLTIPDPCELDAFTNDRTNEELINLINAHTTCIVPAQGAFEFLPSIGDRVYVILRNGDIGPFDMQYCYFDEVEHVNNYADDALRRTANSDCTNLIDIFKLNATLADTLGDLEEQRLGGGALTTNQLVLAATGREPAYGGNDDWNGHPNLKTPRGFGTFSGSIVQKIANNDPSIWPAKVYAGDGSDNYIEVNEYYSPIVKGLKITSIPQCCRKITVTENGVRKTKTANHNGIDVGTGATGDIPLYAGFPGVVQRAGRFSNKQPDTTKLAWIRILSPIEFNDGTKVIFQSNYMHLSSYFASDGAKITSGKTKIAATGGAKDQLGSGGTTGRHLHWEVKTYEFNKDVTAAKNAYFGGKKYDPVLLYRGQIINPTNGSRTATGIPENQATDEELV